MANEKSRNHEPTSAHKGDSGKAQGKPDSDKQASDEKKRSAPSASGKPGPGLQPRDQLNVKGDAKSPGQAR
jgi:hypothetical protein